MINAKLFFPFWSNIFPCPLLSYLNHKKGVNYEVNKQLLPEADQGKLSLFWRSQRSESWTSSGFSLLDWRHLKTLKKEMDSDHYTATQEDCLLSVEHGLCIQPHTITIWQADCHMSTQKVPFIHLISSSILPAWYIILNTDRALESKDLENTFVLSRSIKLMWENTLKHLNMARHHSWMMVVNVKSCQTLKNTTLMQTALNLQLNFKTLFSKNKKIEGNTF